MLLLLLTESLPTVTAAIVLSPRNIRITWTPPRVTATITGYAIVWYARVGFADDGNTTVTNTTTTYDIDELEEFVTYDITVNAIFSNTPGPSDVITLRTLSDSKYN